jgi:hypothetical protein
MSALSLFCRPEVKILAKEQSGSWGYIRHWMIFKDLNNDGRYETIENIYEFNIDTWYFKLQNTFSSGNITIPGKKRVVPDESTIYHDYQDIIDGLVEGELEFSEISYLADNPFTEFPDTTIVTGGYTAIVYDRSTQTNIGYIDENTPSYSSEYIQYSPVYSNNTEDDDFGKLLDEIYNDMNVTLSPNPVKDNVQLKFGMKAALLVSKVEILNIIGRVIYSEEKGSESEMLIDCSGFEQGIYFVKLISKDFTGSLKFIIKK